MKQLTVQIEEPSPIAFKTACRVMLDELKRRRVKRSAAPPLPSGGRAHVAKVVKRGPYALRYVEGFYPNWGHQARLDTIYGRKIKWQN